MSIIQPIPHNARYVSASNIFSAAFNSPTIGKYDFGVAGNQNVDVLELQPNSIYYIDTMSIGGNITTEDYLGAINTLPKLTLRRKIGTENLYSKQVPIVQFFQEKQISNFVKSDKGGDFLTMSFEGVLNQTSSLLGISSVSINVFLSIYIVDDNYYNTAIREAMPMSYAQNGLR